MGPRIADELVRDGTLGVLAALFVVLIYLWFRFEWQFAVGAVIATNARSGADHRLLRDHPARFRYDLDRGNPDHYRYSLNDTVVVYDRIREMMRKYKKLSTDDMIDIAINSTLSRTVITSVTTILALIALSIFGGKASAPSFWANAVWRPYRHLFVDPSSLHRS